MGRLGADRAPSGGFSSKYLYGARAGQIFGHAITRMDLVGTIAVTGGFYGLGLVRGDRINFRGFRCPDWMGPNVVLSEPFNERRVPMSQFLYIYRWDGDPPTRSPEQMQKNMQKW